MSESFVFCCLFFLLLFSYLYIYFTNASQIVAFASISSFSVRSFPTACVPVGSLCMIIAADKLIRVSTCCSKAYTNSAQDMQLSCHIAYILVCDNWITDLVFIWWLKTTNIECHYHTIRKVLINMTI